jgi:hypothetical protein
LLTANNPSARYKGGTVASASDASVDFKKVVIACVDMHCEERTPLAVKDVTFFRGASIINMVAIVLRFRIVKNIWVEKKANN